eukprot:COSAG01_NODE_23003_length_832_cov_1.551160_1_plen_93_part_10
MFAPCLRDCQLCDAGEPFFLLVLLPLLGRAVLDWALGRLKAKCERSCCKEEEAGGQALLGDDRGGFKMSELNYKGATGWDKARKQNRQRPCGA